ncbi:MAG: hypothetical protein PVG53_02970 [Holophagae bacterium]|jgi:hypothetical protein
MNVILHPAAAATRAEAPRLLERMRRATLLPASCRGRLRDHLTHVKTLHDQDLADGLGRVHVPEAFARKAPSAAADWRWQYVFPAGSRGTDPRTGKTRRHHLHESVVRKSIYRDTRESGVAKGVGCHTLNLAKLDPNAAVF